MPEELDPRSPDESPTLAPDVEPTSDSSGTPDVAPSTSPEPGSPTAGTADDSTTGESEETSPDHPSAPAALDSATESTPASSSPESPAAPAAPPIVRGLRYAVDIVFCIDVTGSMTPIIDAVKANALRFYEDVQTNLTAKGKNVDTLRVRVIAFRDFTSDAAAPLQESSFYSLPEEQTAFDGFVSGLVADGGGDAAESGLEALSLAINSPWTTVGDRRRQVIVVWTDAPAHPLNLADLPPDLATSVPSNFSDLTDLWEDPQGPVGSSSKRLILFAPDGPGWGEISANWENVVHHPSEAGSGLSEVDYGTIVDSIGNSV
ncbi:vWA domain-containing protein [Nakamurella sp. A5-74]|uniref:VWA domain-containing protein n=1 Tax=Nakamurella sp. A5-74 TaxID=3158264 RepID=A0AAU8DR25_9ACTN